WSFPRPAGGSTRLLSAPSGGHVLRVGLTGGIGFGQGEGSRGLAARGAFLIDADVAAREVVEPGTPGLGQIAAVFGPGVLLPDGRLNRERLRHLVLAHPAP